MTTKPARSKCSTKRSATISAIILVGIVDALAYGKAQGERERVGEVGRFGRVWSLASGRGKPIESEEAVPLERAGPRVEANDQTVQSNG